MTIKLVKTIWMNNKDVGQPDPPSDMKQLAVASKYLSIGSLKKEFEKHSENPQASPACVQRKWFQRHQHLLSVDYRWFRYQYECLKNIFLKCAQHHTAGDYCVFYNFYTNTRVGTIYVYLDVFTFFFGLEMRYFQVHISKSKNGNEVL